MAFVSGIGTETVVLDIFNYKPEAGECISQWHQIVMRGDSMLTVAERELIAAYTSGLNACTLCYGVHARVAGFFGIKDGLLDKLIEDIDTADIENRLKPLLHFSKKLTLEPAKVTQQDADAVFAVGWSEQALSDAVNVVCMFNFMNRLVLGHGGTEGDVGLHIAAGAELLSSKGYVREE